MIIILITRFVIECLTFFLIQFLIFLHYQDIRPYIKPTKPEIISTPTNNNLTLPIPSNPNSSIWPKNNTQVTNKNKHQFTMKREYDKAREEAELVKQLRNVSIDYNILILYSDNKY